MEALGLLVGPMTDEQIVKSQTEQGAAQQTGPPQEARYSQDDKEDRETQRKLAGKGLQKAGRRGMIKTTRQEWRQIQIAQMQKYAGMEESDIPERDYVFAHDQFYLIRNHGLGTFDVTLRLDPATEQMAVNRIIRGNTNEDHGQFGVDDRETDGQDQSDERGSRGRGPDAGDGGEHPGVLRMVQESDGGPDTEGVLRESSRDLGGQRPVAGGDERGSLTERETGGGEEFSREPDEAYVRELRVAPYAGVGVEIGWRRPGRCPSGPRLLRLSGKKQEPLAADLLPMALFSRCFSWRAAYFRPFS